MYRQVILEFGGRRTQCGLDTFDVSSFRQVAWLLLDFESMGQRQRSVNECPWHVLKASQTSSQAKKWTLGPDLELAFWNSRPVWQWEGHGISCGTRKTWEIKVASSEKLVMEEYTLGSFLYSKRHKNQNDV